jgi:hypothetical protein
MKRLRGWVALSAASATLLAAGAVQAEILVPHRAIYDLSLDPSGGSSDVSDLTGRMVMEFTGSSCAGFRTVLRFVTEIEDSEGEHRVTDTRSTSFEHAGGKSFEFSNQTFIDQSLTEESRGSAERTTRGIGVALQKPGNKHLDLGSTVVFPTQQIEAIVGAAKRGDTFVQSDLYDGSEDGETVFGTSAIIGKPRLGGSEPQEVRAEEDRIAAAGLANVRHWPIKITYFDAKANGEQTPTYTMAYTLYENGISRTLAINYGNFAVTGRLSAIQVLPSEACKKD